MARRFRSQKLIFNYFYRTLLALIVLAAIIAVIANGTLLLQGPMSDDDANAAEWLSAISTFWSAVATAVGALLTGGALVYAARTYERQRKDRQEELVEKRQAAAEAVTVDIDDVKFAGVINAALGVANERSREKRIEVRNDGDRAVFGIALVLLNKDLKEVYQEPYPSVPPKDARGFSRPSTIVGAAYATFTDGAGVRWKRWHNGDLIEIPHYPTATSVPEAL